MGSRWARAEKRAAQAFGLERNLRANYGAEGPDLTEHPYLGLEVKSRKKISSFLTEGLAQAKRYFKDKPPALVIFEKGKHQSVVVMYTDDLIKLLETKGLSKSDSDLDGILEISQGDDGKIKIRVNK